MNNQHKEINILLVDDEPNNLRVLTAMLGEKNYETRGVLNGSMALKASKLMPPDLILLDIMMPQMDGYEVCRQLKADPLTCEIPVIFVSAKDQAIDKVKAFGVGGVDYITKPFQFEEVLARIETHLKLRQLQQQLQHQNTQLQTEVADRQNAEQALKEKNGLLQHEIYCRQKIEAVLQKTNEELAAANAELDQFACLASHDLRAPLTSIFSYVQLFLMRYKEKVDPDGLKYLQNALKACQRMQLLIDDLLTYSRTGKMKNDFEPVDCNAVIEQACENLEKVISETKTVFTYSQLPTVKGDDSLLIQLFQNLIANAIQYCQEETPYISIMVTLKDSQYLFAIKDNGIGIETQYYEQIFQVFQRLHTQAEYPGTGIGLAICRKIVELHGGQIWVESELGNGSTFYFTLEPSLEEQKPAEVPAKKLFATY
jgi:signal transduction histidine kinase